MQAEIRKDFEMKRYKNIKPARSALLLCLAVLVASVAATSCFAASLNVLRFNRRNANTSDVPPIGEGLESSAEDIVDGIGDGAETVVDGAESFFDGVESDLESGLDEVTDMMDGMETNIPDSDIGGAVEDDDKDGLSNPTDSDDDNDGTPDGVDTDSDNDGVADSSDADPDGDGKEGSSKTAKTVGIVIAILAVGAIAILAFVLMPKREKK